MENNDFNRRNQMPMDQDNQQVPRNQSENFYNEMEHKGKYVNSQNQGQGLQSEYESDEFEQDEFGQLKRNTSTEEKEQNFFNEMRRSGNDSPASLQDQPGSANRGYPDRHV